MIPEILKNKKSWCCWKLINKAGRNKPTKVPVSSTGKPTYPNDSSVWESFEVCRAKSDKIGYFFNEDFIGIDLDNCVENGIINSHAQYWLATFNSYAEYSPSGTGIHIIVENTGIPGTKRKNGNYEIYNKGRYFAMTGNIVDSKYSTIISNKKAILEFYLKAVSSKNEEKKKYEKAYKNSGNQQKFVETVLSVLAKGKNVCADFDDWKRLAMAFKSINLPYEKVDPIFKNSEGYCREDNEYLYEKMEPNDITFGTAYYYAEKINPEAFKNEIKASSPKRNQAMMLEEFLQNQNLQYDTLQDKVLLNGKPISRLEELCLQHEARKQDCSFSIPNWKATLVSVSARNVINPIQDFINALPKWDGIDYLGQLVGCLKDRPSKISARRKLEIFFTKAFQRWQTGEQCPTLVISSERQRLGKSTLVKWLHPIGMEYFKSGCVDPDCKEHRIARSYKMFWEISELESTTRRKDIGSLKTFLTEETVSDRKAYDTDERTSVAKTVFIATVNTGNGFFVDTENRRFLVLDLEDINWEYTKINKLQLYSQMKTLLEQNPQTSEFTKEELEIQKDENREYNLVSSLGEILKQKYEITNDPNDFIGTIDIITDMGVDFTKIKVQEIHSNMVVMGAKPVRRTLENGSKKRGFCGIKKMLPIELKVV